jgi:methionyl-tRNA formyltransferase
MSRLTLVFAGTPEFAVPPLEALLANEFNIAAVYTQPDRPSGRGQKLHLSAVKQCAQRNGLNVEQPSSLRAADVAARLASYRPDVMIVVAYGMLLPQAILDIPRLGCLNIHASVLPRWRGAAPIQRAVLAGDTETGISIMRMDAGLDTGPILSIRKAAIEPRENAASLHDRLALLGAQLIGETLSQFAAGTVQPQAQPQDGITYAPKIRKDEAAIDWRRPAIEIDRQVRAFNPWPVAETRWREQQLRIWAARAIDDGPAASVPGTVLSAASDGIVVTTGSGLLVIERLQLAGRREMSAADFVHAHRIVGECLQPS